MGKKYYAIKQGRKIGVFTGQWKDIQRKYIQGFPNAECKGFNDIKEAKKYLAEPPKLREKVEGRDKKQVGPTQLETEQKNKEKRIEKKHSSSKLIYSEYIDEHKERTTVSIALLGHQKMHLSKKPGCYEYILIHEESGTFKLKESDYTPHTSTNRAIIYGLIDAIKKLNKPCHIKVYTKGSFGFNKMIKDSKSPNTDVLKELKELLINSEHVIEAIIDTEKVEFLFNNYK